MKTIVGLFDDKKDAEAVHDRLKDAGVSGDRLHKIKGGMLHGDGYDKLVRLGVDSAQASSFAEGLRRGGEVIACTCDESEVNRLLPFFHQYRMADIDKRSQRWRSTGWTGYDRKATAFGQTDIDQERRWGANEYVIPVVQEHLKVGKREIEGGQVHVETKVREMPVQENVTLRQESVDVQRRPADRPLTARDEPFQERTIDVSAKSEQAVVAKEARVVEEVVVKKDVQQVTQPIRDTVKKTEVKVDRDKERISRPSRDSRQSVP